MGLLLDTYYVYAFAGTPARLSVVERRVLKDTAHSFIVSAVSIWEIRLKWEIFHTDETRGGLRGPEEILGALRDLGICFLSLMTDHAAADLAVRMQHRDPFDALLLVQAQEERHRLLTRDANSWRIPWPWRPRHCNQPR